MIFARAPYFVEQEGVGWLNGAMQIILDAALFAASGSDQRAQLGFEQSLLAGLGAQDHDKRHGVFG